MTSLRQSKRFEARISLSKSLDCPLALAAAGRNQRFTRYPPVINHNLGWCNYIPHRTMIVITYPCHNLISTNPGNICICSCGLGHLCLNTEFNILFTEIDMLSFYITFSSPAISVVAKIAISEAARDENFIKMTIFLFQCLQNVCQSILASMCYKV